MAIIDSGELQCSLYSYSETDVPDAAYPTSGYICSDTARSTATHASAV
jgi:hypothetical protein